MMPVARPGPLPRRPVAALAALGVTAASALALATGGAGALAAVLLSAGASAAALRLAAPAPSAAGADPVTGLADRPRLEGALDRALATAREAGRSAGTLLIELEGFRALEGRLGRAALDQILRAAADRLGAVLRDGDVAARLDGATFAVALDPSRELDLESAIQLGGRLQRSLSEPVATLAGATALAATVGLALSGRLRDPTGEALLRGATLALLEAQRTGPGTLRSYSEAMLARVEARGHLAAEVAGALDRGEIEAHFQPQLSTRTGAITGFEALARWRHPARGLLPPAEFLPAIEQAGLMGRLGERMLHAALTALRGWAEEGLDVPSVAVNFSHAELCDPSLLERIGWEIDRFDLTPDRLVIEVLESVVASGSENAVVRNLAGLAHLGCCLDLDDFGTGQATIGAIRRFSIERIKIDRSFVSRLDEDPEQARIVGAILTMAERMGLDTLAEGVETEGERLTLTRLGCGHVQGFGIARPMPYADTIPWIRAMAGDGAVPPPRKLRVV